MKKQTLQEFINKSKTIFNNTLDYSKVDYINSRTNVILICKIHGEFKIAPKDHISYKRSCQFCDGKYTTQSFIEKCVQIHNNIYSYSEVVFIGMKNKITIICKNHGKFLQTPDKHINGQGCKKCNKPRRDLEYFLSEAKKIHKNKYDYSKVIFTKMFDNVIIICPKHGEFKQLPANHINHKTRCPSCAVGKSKKETMWLDSINLPNNKNTRSVILNINNKRFIVDGFDPFTKTVYEFYGNFWHGNPKIYKTNDINDQNHMLYGDLFNKTLDREQEIINAGYKIISIWEDDFDLQTKLDRRSRKR